MRRLKCSIRPNQHTNCSFVHESSVRITRDTPTAWDIRKEVRITVALTVAFALTSCVSERNHTHRSPSTVDVPQLKANVSEMPSDPLLASALGVTMRTVEVRYPSSMKLSWTTRLYRAGVLDHSMSSRQVSGTTLAVGSNLFSLGLFDPDVTSPEPQGKLKIFGSPGTVWIKKPPAGSHGGFIDVPRTGELPTGTNQLVMELAYGSGNLRGWSGGWSPDSREGAAVRITIHVLVEPLTTEQRELLKKQSNFNEVYTVDE
jgi:hypothetical protein